MLSVHPLLQRLLSLYGECDDLDATAMITDLFINISAVNEHFVSDFLLEHFARVISVSRSFPTPLPLVLAYNLLSVGGSWLLRDAEQASGLLRRVVGELASDTEQLVLSAPFLLVAVLRSLPVQSGDDHVWLAALLARILEICGADRAEMPLWAVYFWFRNNLGTELWDALPPELAVAIAGYLSATNPAIRRLAVYATAHLWLAPDGHPALAALEEVFDCRQVVGMMADDDAREVGLYVDILIANYIAFMNEKADELIPDIIEAVKRQLDGGSARVKVGAVYLAGTLLSVVPEGLVNSADAELIESLGTALELEDPEVTEIALAAIARLGRNN
jgi:hypothetical protein